MMERLTTEFEGYSVPKEFIEVDKYDIAAECKDCFEICEEANNNCKECAIQRCFNKLAEYEDAEEKGLLLHLPFDVGSEIYVLTKRLHIKSGKTYTEIEKFTIRKYVYNSLKNFVIVGIRKYGGDVVEEHFFKEEIGKIVFEKYAEAEAALKKMQEGEK